MGAKKGNLSIRGDISDLSACDLEVEIKFNNDKEYFPDKTISLIDVLYTMGPDSTPEVFNGDPKEKPDDIFIVVGFTASVRPYGGYSYYFVNIVDHSEIYIVGGLNGLERIKSGKFTLRPAVGCSKEFINDLSDWIPRLMGRSFSK